MDSLLSTYASSSDDEESPPHKQSKFSLPPPKSSSSSSSTKKVVQFRPPVNLSSIKSTNLDDEDDYEDAEEKERKRKKAELAGQTSSVKSFLSNIPAPKNSVSLGVLGSALGTGRRSVIDTDVQESDLGVSGAEGDNTSGDYSSNYVNFDGYNGYVGGDGNVVDYSNNYSSNVSDYGNYDSNNNWSEGSSREAVPEVPIERAFRLPMKRGRKDDPPQIIEVSQDELMKNRPREDQAKSTGIAFGPAYQPASSKGKPTKLHKRKHQIGALYFDMKSKETELAERRSKGFLTKAQTQGKYGW